MTQSSCPQCWHPRDRYQTDTWQNTYEVRALSPCALWALEEGMLFSTRVEQGRPVWQGTGSALVLDGGDVCAVFAVSRWIPMGLGSMKAKGRNSQAGTIDPFCPQYCYMKVSMKLASCLGLLGGGPAVGWPERDKLKQAEVRGLQGLHPTRGTMGMESATGRPPVIWELSELILLHQHVGKAFWQGLGALMCWFYCKLLQRATENINFPHQSTGRKKVGRGKRQLGGQNIFAI